jgi:DNA-binding response OmpR family regulator
MPKILIADDSRFYVQTLTSWLGPKGFEIITALDAIQTWTSALRASPDLIVLDINMPAGNGLEILRRLRSSAKTQRIPVIVVTGDGNPAMEASARGLGAGEFFHKPVEEGQICAAVKRLLAQTSEEPAQRLKVPAL